MAYNAYGIERAIFNPDVMVVAGPWETSMGRLHHAGWKFDVELRHDSRNVMVRARNPISGLVFVLSAPGNAFDREVWHNMLYFPESMIMTSDQGVFREMIVPQIDDMVRADVGMVHLGYGNGEPVTHILSPRIEEGSQDIIVTPDKVPMLLEEIRKAQEPQARELLHRQRRRSGNDIPNELKQKAKILTFG